MPKIRPYTPKDYPAILAIYAASKLDELRYEEAGFTLLPLDKDEKRLDYLLESAIYICEDNGIIGFCANCGAEIRALFVHPDWRGKGVGRCMLEFLLARIPGPAHLCVARSNMPAKNLYMQYGFKIVEDFETSYNGVPVIANKMIRQQSRHNRGDDMSRFTLDLYEKGRCRIRHDLAGTEIITDLPPEYGGRGRSFSSTDLLCAALGSCILTSIDTILEREGYDPKQLRVSVEKSLSEKPKMISAIALTIFYPEKLSDLLLTKLERAAAACPVKRSLNEAVDITIRFVTGSES